MCVDRVVLDITGGAVHRSFEVMPHARTADTMALVAFVLIAGLKLVNSSFLRFLAARGRKP